MRRLTPRRIEAVRTVRTGSVAGVAACLNVSPSGLSHRLKRAEESLRIGRFKRKSSVFPPEPEAQAAFRRINDVHAKLEEPAEIRIFAVSKKNRSLSACADFALGRLRDELRAARDRPGEAQGRT